MLVFVITHISLEMARVRVVVVVVDKVAIVILRISRWLHCYGGDVTARESSHAVIGPKSVVPSTNRAPSSIVDCPTNLLIPS